MAKAGELARRAKESGKLRPDFVSQDLVLVVMADSGIRAAGAEQAVQASRRFAALAIEGFRAAPGAAPLPPASWTPRLTPAL